MAQRKGTDPDHRWAVAVTHIVSRADADYAFHNEVLHFDSGGQADVAAVYCDQCKRPYDDVAGEVCEAASEGYEHLTGGPIGRRKRIHDHDCNLFGCNPTLTPTQAEALRRLAANPVPYRVDHGPDRWHGAV